jgi:hypothetical protein
LDNRGYIIKKLFFICALAISPALFAQEQQLTFHGSPWGTSIADFTAKMGRNPVQSDEINGFRVLIYNNIRVYNYSVYMVAYFSSNGLEGGTYYFDTASYDELIQCYISIQNELRVQYGETYYYSIIHNRNEMAPYESGWDINNSFIKLKVDTRLSDPVTLWYFSPALARSLVIKS